MPNPFANMPQAFMSAFGEPAKYKRKSDGALLDITAFIELAGIVVEVGADGYAVETVKPLAHVRTSDVPAPRHEDLILGGGYLWRVVQVQDDGRGMARLVLRELYLSGAVIITEQGDILLAEDLSVRIA